MPPSLGQMMVASGVRHSNQPALWADGSTVSYAELLNHGQRIAAGLGAARRCAVFGTRSLWSYAGVVGSLLAGAIYVPLNTRHPRDRLLTILATSEVDAIILDDRSLPVARELLEQVPQRLTVLLPDSQHIPDWAARHRFLCHSDLASDTYQTVEQEGAYLLFTSGSTGTPKGVLVGHRNVLAYLDNVAARYGLTPDDRCTQLFDMTFDLSAHDMFATWQAGATLYSPPDSARMAPHAFIRRHELTSWFSVPSTIAIMAQLRLLRPNEFPTLRWSLFCGEALPRSLVTQWAKAAPNSIIDNLYGPTETTIAITVYRLPSDLNEMVQLPEIIPIGTPFADHKVAILDGDGQPSEEGELLLSGPQVSLGYWRQPDLTAEQFAPPAGEEGAWYRTGDRARHSQYGLLFLGRLDRQVKISGHRIELQEVEAALRGIAGNINVAVIAWPIDATGLARGLVGFVADHGLSTEQILQACRQKLPPYMTPSQIHRVANWPLNTNGKTDYTLLRTLAGSEHGQ